MARGSGRHLVTFRIPVVVALLTVPSSEARGTAPLPWGLDLLLTDACNLRCSYCPSADGVARAARFVDTARAIAFLDSVAHFRPMIRLIGGEPFLHPEWKTILAAAVERGLPVTAVTNGTRLAGLADELVRSGLLALGISLDPPASNDRDRGEGVFATCEAMIAEVALAKGRHRSRTPYIEIYTTIHEGTYRSLTRWAERLTAWPIDTLRFQHRIWVRSDQRAKSEDLLREAVGDATFFRGEVASYCTDALPPLDTAILAAQMERLKSTGYPFRVEFHPALPEEEATQFYASAAYRRETARACALTSSYAFVDPAGRLYPCFTLEMGNVFDAPFDEVWNGERFRALRRLLAREGRLPFCERCTA